jgi:hypothetical protein
MEIYKKADAWLVARINDLYLWVFDWTGMFVATFIFLDMTIVVLSCIQRQSMWIGAMVFLCSTLISLPRYILQNKGPEAYNRLVLAGGRGSFYVRTFFLFFNGTFLITDTIKGAGYLELAANFANIALWFLMEIKIRDRQKKDFKLPKLATASGRS